MKKILLVKANTEEELVEKINNLKEDITSSHPPQKVGKNWVYFGYYEPKLENEKPEDKNKPTEKQEAFLRKNKKWKENLTRKEASEIIKETIKSLPKRE